MNVPRRLYKTNEYLPYDIVEEDDPRAAFLLCPAGALMSDADAEAQGITAYLATYDKAHAKAVKQSEMEDKAMHKAEAEDKAAAEKAEADEAEAERKAEAKAEREEKAEAKAEAKAEREAEAEAEAEAKAEAKAEAAEARRGPIIPPESRRIGGSGRRS